MNEEDIRTLKSMERELEEEKIRRMGIENRYSRDMNANFEGMDNQNKNIVETQLDLQNELDRIHHLLKGDVLEVIENNEVWVEPKDDRLKILSDYGVKQIMNLVYFYINKNTLLSNYDEDTIFWKVRDFGIELSDLIFNRYEAFFSYPSIEELYEKSMRTIRNNPTKFPTFIIQLENGKSILNEELIYTRCVQWSKEEMQSKLRHYPTIVMALVDSVHSTFLRALNGEERESIRKQMYIHASMSSNVSENQPTNKFKLTKPSTWNR